MNKLKLFENTFNKISGDRAFMAFYLNEVAVKEKRSQDEMVLLLNCSLENYYKLALCKAPEINEDFDARLSKIAEYINTDAVILGNIIKYASTNEISENKQINSKIWNNFKTLITFPEWLIRSQAKIYQASVSVCIVVLLVFSYTSQKNETKNSQLFVNDYFSYTDSIKYTQLQDNTYVQKNNL